MLLAERIEGEYEDNCDMLSGDDPDGLRDYDRAKTPNRCIFRQRLVKIIDCSSLAL